MQIYNDLTYIKNSSLGLGFFDALHLGHKVVLKNVIHTAKKYNTTSVAIIFKEHPLNFLTNQKVEQILTLEEKIKMFESIGIDNLIILDFNKFSNMKASDYLKNIIIKYFSPIAITTGFNHSFGYKKEGTSEFLRQNSHNYNYTYYEIPPFVINDTLISCSTIRNRIKLGDFVFANNMLGYKFFINGIVIEGDKIARTIGFPSANIEYSEEKIKIPFGVYYVIVEINSKKYNGILNYGYAPTLNNTTNLKTEVHILNFNQNIYGESIKISFVTKIRNQMNFKTKDKLKDQIIRDIAFCNIYQYFIK